MFPLLYLVAQIRLMLPDVSDLQLRALTVAHQLSGVFYPWFYLALLLTDDEYNSWSQNSEDSTPSEMNLSKRKNLIAANR